MASAESQGSIRVTQCAWVMFDHRRIPVINEAIIILWERSNRNKETKDLGLKLLVYLNVLGDSDLVFQCWQYLEYRKCSTNICSMDAYMNTLPRRSLGHLFMSNTVILLSKTADTTWSWWNKYCHLTLSSTKSEGELMYRRIALWIHLPSFWIWRLRAWAYSFIKRN